VLGGSEGGGGGGGSVAGGGGASGTVVGGVEFRVPPSKCLLLTRVTRNKINTRFIKMVLVKFNFLFIVLLSIKQI